LSDEELTAAALKLRDRIKASDTVEDDEEDDDPPVKTPHIDSRERLIQICSLGREAARRGLGERPYDVQLLGTMSLLAGHVAEMATGEGKTLTAALAAYGYALRGEPVHVLTVNDYLAQRDANWMRPVYDLLGVSVGWITASSTREERREAYSRDVTYLTVTEAGFDYLRDQLAMSADEEVQPPLAVAIVDEADSILIDEARIPMVLAGSVSSTQDIAVMAASVVSHLNPDVDYEVSDDGRNVSLTASGAAKVESELGGIDLYAEENLETLTAINLALHAHALLRRDVDYIVRDGHAHLVDEFRGRIAHRRRWPDGLQAAVEAKEGLRTSADGEVLGTITIQALMKLYPTVCGMTGTAVSVGDALREFYDLEVAVIPPNRPNIRIDEPDRVYATAADKEEAIIAEVAEAHAIGRPVLIGTLSVAESERLAAGLRAAGLECQVLNAKNDAEEARIIADAGRRGAITVSTQMAGRGTDIRLGGSGDDVDESAREEVAQLGGLLVIGAGRHESSRVDNQLRGRAGRQGDPGGSVFFVSLEDELVVRYGQDAIPQVTGRGLLLDPAAARAIAHAQRVCEGANLEIHRNTWRYHVLIEQQRQLVQARRRELRDTDAALKLLNERTPDRYDEVLDEVGEEALLRAARQIALYHIDRGWSAHLATLAEVREGIYLRALGRLDPLDEFHRAALEAFRRLLSDVDDNIVKSFEELEITKEGVDLEAAGLNRPTATWTYVVQDNPFGSELDRFFTAALGKITRRR